MEEGAGQAGPAAGTQQQQQALQIGLDQFDFVKIIGTGTFGRVALAKYKQDGSFCAVKILEKDFVVKSKQVEHTLSEKQILLGCQNQFVVRLMASFKDNANLFMVLEYVPGGELFYHLRTAKVFPEPTIAFYAIEIGVAVEYLHANGIVYRDLKPENVLLDAGGHIKLTDFGFAKRIERTTWTVCGTPEYMSPEIIMGKGYEKAVDWWSYGVLLFEMAVGHPPFEGSDEIEIYKAVLGAQPAYPPTMSPSLKDLIANLLHVDRTRRLGNMFGGTNDIKSHAWFGHNGWQLHAVPPIQPPLQHAGDTSNFETFADIPLKQSGVDEHAGLFLDF